MLSEYSKMLINNEDFKKHNEILLNELKDKKILIYGAGSAFLELDKIFNYSEKLNVVAISDKKFEDNPVDYKGIKAIAPNDIINFEFDKVLITNENAFPIKNFLEKSLSIPVDKIISIYPDEIKDEPSIYNYITQFNFQKQLEKLTKKLKNKTIVIYGAGAFFQVIQKYFDLSKLNIIALCDKKFENRKEDEMCLGYKVCSLDEIKTINPDYVLVGTKFYTSIIEDVYEKALTGTKIKIRALVKKPFMTLLREIWG